MDVKKGVLSGQVMVQVGGQVMVSGTLSAVSFSSSQRDPVACTKLRRLSERHQLVSLIHQRLPLRWSQRLKRARASSTRADLGAADGVLEPTRPRMAQSLAL